MRHFAHSAEHQPGWTRAQAVGSLQLCGQLRWEASSWAGQCFGAVERLYNIQISLLWKQVVFLGHGCGTWLYEGGLGVKGGFLQHHRLMVRTKVISDPGVPDGTHSAYLPLKELGY